MVVLEICLCRQGGARGVRHLFYALKARRGYSGNTTFRFIEILNFKHFARYFTFDPVDNLGRNKRLNDYLNVSVLLRVECGDMSETE